MEGSCHCGSVRITLPEPPGWVVQCGCSICAKLGVLWAYYPDGDNVAGATDSYACNNRVIAFHRCRTCGCTTHWRTLGRDFGRMGINARLLDLDLAKTQIRSIPGRRPRYSPTNGRQPIPRISPLSGHCRGIACAPPPTALSETGGDLP